MLDIASFLFIYLRLQNEYFYHKIGKNPYKASRKCETIGYSRILVLSINPAFMHWCLETEKDAYHIRLSLY